MQSRTLRRALSLSALLPPLSLTACGDKAPIHSVSDIVVREHYTAATPDESLRHCKPRPSKRPVKSDVDTANLVIDFAEYGDDCASKLNSTWQSIDQAKASADKLNAAQQEKPK